MKKCILTLIALVAVIILVGCKKDEKKSEQSVPSESAESKSSTAGSSTSVGVAAAPPFKGGRKTSFQEVTSQLDPGGSLFLYLATDQWLAGLSTNIAQFQQIVGVSPKAYRRSFRGSRD